MPGQGCECEFVRSCVVDTTPEEVHTTIDSGPVKRLPRRFRFRKKRSAAVKHQKSGEEAESIEELADPATESREVHL